MSAPAGESVLRGARKGIPRVYEKKRLRKWDPHRMFFEMFCGDLLWKYLWKFLFYVMIFYEKRRLTLSSRAY